ncbi:formimidoylglutamase [Gulosibacter sediminis]|uniref:formimidoylglutamase n=1 Tax=Gulosibacter sediminis TaxID=1729695 RepID=UPI001866F384|nr:formimidoylglutamase [Gulosibacter sediminis]
MKRAPSGWSGRNDGEGAEHLRWHNAIRPWPDIPGESGTVLLGFSSDEGVRRNLGRPGARKAPDALRWALSSMAIHNSGPLYDAGDICVEGEELENGQLEFGDMLAQILAAGNFTVGLGGGHEITYASYLGFKKASLNTQSERWGIINLDAHFDNRQADRASSGTGFFQIHEDALRDAIDIKYLTLGISSPSNTQILFERANEIGIDYVTDEQLNRHGASLGERVVGDFLEQIDHLYLTVDIDVLPASVAPGVSAPAAYGVPLEVVRACILNIAESSKLRHADFAELNPEFDIDQRTARTAARLIHDLVTTRSEI